MASGAFFKVGLIFMIVGALIFGVFGKVRQVFARDRKKAILYLLGALLSFALVGLLGHKSALGSLPLPTLIIFQGLFFLLGCLHLYLISTFFEWMDEDRFVTSFLFTMGLSCLGTFIFLLVVSRTADANYSYLFLSAVIAFILPFLILKTFHYALLIPVSIFKKWYYPIEKKIGYPNEERLINPMVLSFLFRKKQNDEAVTNFRVKAPEGMEFGELFYHFINDYNERFPESKIEVVDGEHQACGWLFYLKPNWFGHTSYINPNRSALSNGLKEDLSIICQRT